MTRTLTVLFLAAFAAAACSSASEPNVAHENEAIACTSGASSANGVTMESCGWGCTDTCSSQAIGEPGGPFYCDRPTSCGIWPWCPTATLVTGPLDSPQCECQCK